jgi:leucyl-tRNA synthetase
VPVPDSDLPVLLPDNVEITLAGRLAAGQGAGVCERELSQVRCPARRETDTMDTFVDSSWYFYRYTDPDSNRQALLQL